jgi:aminoglycoside phosphotransferase (APT) family kinase protein
MSYGDQDFLEERHRSFETPEKVIFDLVEKATGKKATARNRIVAGFDNEVYSVKVSDGKEYITRVRRFGEVTFHQEAWAIEQSKAKGVPVPQILLMDNIEQDGKKLEVMVTDKFDGVPLYDKLKTLSESDLHKILFDAGSILGKINGIPVDGFYMRHEDGSWDFPSWERMMETAIKERGAEKDRILKNGFSEEEFDFMIKGLERYKNEFPNQQPVLCHGDYLPEHIFINENNEVIGIIDFGMSQGGQKIHDLAFFSMEWPSIDMKPLKDGYVTQTNLPDQFDAELNFCKLGLEMGHLAYQTQISNTKGAGFIAKQLRATLEALKA